MLFWVKRIIKNSLVKFLIWDDSNNTLLLSVYINKHGYIWIICIKIF